MNVSLRPRGTFAEIFSDADYLAMRSVLDAATPLVRRFFVDSLRRFRASEKINGPFGIHTHRQLFLNPSASSDEVAAAESIADAMINLYGRHDVTHVRGALLEALVLHRLTPRYGSHTLGANVDVTVTNDHNFACADLDVLGWDGDVGEYHDCKTSAKWFDTTLINALQAGLPNSHFRIGLVTLTAERRAVGTIRSAGIRLPSSTTVIALERVWDLAPLQRATA